MTMRLFVSGCAIALSTQGVCGCSASSDHPSDSTGITPGHDASALAADASAPETGAPDTGTAGLGADAADDASQTPSDDGGEAGTTASTDDGSGGGAGGGSGGGPNDAASTVVLTPICPAGAMWAAASLLPISTALDDHMGSITPDELTIAWTTTNGSSVTVMVADRSATSSPFGTPMAAPASSGFYAPAKVALSPDGLRLIVAKSDNSAFGVMVRMSRGAAFATAPQGGEVDILNSTISQGELSVQLDDPVIGGHDATFYYSLYGGGLLDTLLESTRPDLSAWPNGSALMAMGGVLQEANPMRRRPTGIAVDDLTLFYWDEVDTTEKIAWRPNPSASFDRIQTLGAFRGAVPNANCDKLYYSAAGDGGGLDLFVATRR